MRFMLDVCCRCWFCGNVVESCLCGSGQASASEVDNGRRDIGFSEASGFTVPGGQLSELGLKHTRYTRRGKQTEAGLRVCRGVVQNESVLKKKVEVLLIARNHHLGCMQLAGGGKLVRL